MISRKYIVAIIELFGYGLSDTIDEPRTINNITDEIREAIEQLGLKDYMMIGHSIAGVYSLEYVDNYPDEVLGFRGSLNTGHKTCMVLCHEKKE